MSNLAEQLFAGSAAKPITDRGTYFEAGRHLVEVLLLQVKQTFEKGPAFIGEFKIVESDTIKAGSTRTYYQSLNGKRATIGLQEIYKLGYACEGIDRRKLDKEEADKVQTELEGKFVVMSKDLYVGNKLYIDVTTRTVTTLVNGKEVSNTYTNHTFSPA